MTESFEVREATSDDIPQLLKWGQEFHQYSTWKNLPLNKAAVVETLIRMIEDADKIILRHERGMIGAVVAPIWINPQKIMAQEVFWWAEKGGSFLLRALEAWASRKGANSLSMISLPDKKQERMTLLYKRAGYRPSEAHFLKDL